MNDTTTPILVDNETFESKNVEKRIIKNPSEVIEYQSINNREDEKYQQVGDLSIEGSLEKLALHSKETQVNIPIFYSLQKWEGTILSINDAEETFTASLIDLKIKRDIKEIGEFLIGDISNDDKELFKVGAIFYWHICYDENEGQRERKSLIRFKRQHYWSNKEIAEAEDESEKLGKMFGW